MNKTVEYKIRGNIEIEHDFYNHQYVPLNLMQTEETNLIFRKTNRIWKKIASNRWVLLELLTDLSDREDLVVSFDLIVISDDFYYVTGNEQSPCNYINYIQTHKVHAWKTISVTFPYVENSSTLTHKLSIQSIYKYYEIILIPRYNPHNITLKIKEEKDRIQWKDSEKNFLIEEKPVWRFVSIAPVYLKSNLEYRIVLLEVRESGERIISNNIPLPRADDISVFSPSDTISTYFYY